MSATGGVSVGGAGAPSATDLEAVPARYANRVKLVSDGVADFRFLLWNPSLQPPPDFSGLPPGVEVRVRTVFPYEGRDVLETLVYAQLPDSQAPISLIYTQVDHIEVSEAERATDRRTVAFSGKIISNPVASPFGAIVGKAMMVGGAFDQTGPVTRFEFFGGLTVGSHATIMPVALGSLEIQGPLESL